MDPQISKEDLIKVINNHIEVRGLEFKEAKNSFQDEELFKYCVAIANCGGGKFILGVSDKIPRHITGTLCASNLPGKEKQIYDKLKFIVRIQEHFIEEQRVLVFHIPARPKGTAYSLDGAYYTRVGESRVVMNDYELQRIHLENNPEWSSLPAKESCTEEDVVELLDTQIFFTRLKVPYPSERKYVIGKFLEEKLIFKSEGAYAITNLGAILLAKDLGRFDSSRYKKPRFIIYEGKDRIRTSMESEMSSGYIVGFEGMMQLINASITTNEIVSKALRQEIKMFPGMSVRELVANALIHQDFTKGGMTVKIELFNDRLEVTSPGAPIVEPHHFVHATQARNEALADLARKLGLCEIRGSGIDKVIRESEIYQLPAPDFAVRNETTISVLFAHKDFKDMTKDDKIRACYQHSCLQHLSNNKMNNSSLRERFGLNTRQLSSVSSIINGTISEELIKVSSDNAKSMKHRTYLPFWA